MAGGWRVCANLNDANTSLPGWLACWKLLALVRSQQCLICCLPCKCACCCRCCCRADQSLYRFSRFNGLSSTIWPSSTKAAPEEEAIDVFGGCLELKSYLRSAGKGSGCHQHEHCTSSASFRYLLTSNFRLLVCFQPASGCHQVR